MDAVIFPLAFLGCIIAVVRRFDTVSLSLLAGLICGTVAAFIFPLSWLVGVLATIEGLIGLAMLVVATDCHNSGRWCERGRRAQAVGLLCMGKVLLLLSWLFGPGHLLSWTVTAAAFNAGLACQIVIAGGWGDGVALLANRGWHRIFGNSVGSASS